MERNKPEWVQRFGAWLRTERVVCGDDPLPEEIAAKLRALEGIERQFQSEESERARGKR